MGFGPKREGRCWPRTLRKGRLGVSLFYCSLSLSFIYHHIIQMRVNCVFFILMCMQPHCLCAWGFVLSLNRVERDLCYYRRIRG